MMSCSSKTNDATKHWSVAEANRVKNVTSGKKPVRGNLDSALSRLIASGSSATMTPTVEENVAAPV